MKKSHKQLRVAAGIAGAVAFYFLAFLLWPLPDAARSACGSDTTPIDAIQGSTGITPLDGERVRVQGVVTADFTAEEELGGFFLQQAGPEAPASETASRGLFVYAPGMRVNPGERLLLGGEAGEYYGMTQISDVRLHARCGGGHAIEPVRVTLPLTRQQRHQLQGMKVRLDPPLVITGLYGLDRYGVVAVADERLYIPTQVRAPGAQARQQAEANERRLLSIDDGRRDRNPPLPGWTREAFDTRGTLRVGDQLSSLVGILDYRYEHWRLQPLTPPSVTTANARPDPLDRPPGNQVRVASFNLQNYFNGDGAGGGFPTPRGASTPKAFARQHQRLVDAASALAADVIGVIEVENDGYGSNSALAELTGALGEGWDYARPRRERLGGDAIAVGIIFRTDRLQPLGPARSLTRAPFDHHNRPPLAQRFRHRATGRTFRVVVNHFKSKRCGEATGENRAQGDGQGCWNPVRTTAATSLADWVDELTAGDGGDRVLLLGDVNAYAREEPMARLREAGFRNVLRGHHPLPASGYVFQAQSGTLDYILSNEAVGSWIRGAGVFPINADEPPLLYYDREKGHAVRQPTASGKRPWRSSDHDPTWVDIEFGAQDGD